MGNESFNLLRTLTNVQDTIIGQLYFMYQMLIWKEKNMKKFLLGTAALTIVLPFMAMPLGAKDELKPSLKFTGETSVNYYAFRQSAREGNKGKGNGHHVGVEDSRFNVDIFGKTEAFGGLEYSALIGLSGNPDDGRVQENRLKFKNEWGTLIAGDTRGVDDFMAVGAFGVMGGTGGFAGNFTNVLNQTTGTIITTDLAGAPKDATKVVYVTPRIGGVQGGLSFTPSTAHEGDHKLETISTKGAKSAPFDKNQVGLGLNFKETFANGIDVKLSATALLGKAQAPVRFTIGQPMRYKDTQAYALGAHLKYSDWEIGGEFIDNGKSRVANQDFAPGPVATNITGRDAGKAYSVAVGYTYGKHKFTAGYFGSTRKVLTGYKHAKTNIYSGVWDRKIAPGLGVYVEANYVDMKTDPRAVADQNNFKSVAGTLGLAADDVADGVKSSNAHIFIVGTKLKF